MTDENWLKKCLMSFKYAWQGIVTFFRMKGNAKIHLIMAALVLAFALFFKLEKIDWIIVLLCIAGVLSAEALNSAIETLSNHVTKEKHPEIKKVKDLSAGAVLFIAIGAAIVGILVFYPYIFKWVQAH